MVAVNDKVDMALDDIIKATKKTQRGRGRGRGRGGRGGRGGNRANQNQTQQTKRGGAARGGRGTNFRNNNRGRQQQTFNAPPKAALQLTTSGYRAKLQAQKQGATVKPGPAKLLISNLDHGVTDKDIQDLFSEFGQIKEAAIHYNSAGRSLSTAHVMFSRHVDALKASKQYNGVKLDGRAMNIIVQSAGKRGGGQGSPVKRLQQGSTGFRGGRVSRGRGFSAGRGGGIQKTFIASDIRGTGNRGSFRGRGGRGGRGGFRGRRGAY